MATSPVFADHRNFRQPQPDYRDTGWNDVDADAVRHAAQILMGLPPSHMERERRGVVNQVWHIRFRHRAGVTLKIAPRWFSGSLRRETNCLRWLDDSGIAVPQMLCLVPAQSDPLPGHDLLVTDTITGATLREEDFTPDRISQLLRPYHRLHQVKVAGYGWFTPHFTGRCQTWRSFLLDLEEAPQAATNALWPTHHARVLRLLEDVPEPDAARLLYGDYNRDNFILRPDGTLVALDFQNCFAGDPVYDWATVLLKEPRKAKDLARTLRFTCHERRNLAAYQARILWNMAVYYAARDLAHSHALIRKLDQLPTATSWS